MDHARAPRRFPATRPAGVLGTLLLAALLLVAPVASAQEEAGEPPEIVLLTMGPDSTVLFRQWGHAALCVGDQCLNYGVTDFSRPVGLVWDVLRSEALFWVAVSGYQNTVDTYARDGRSVFRQRLELSAEQRTTLLETVAPDLVPGQGEYIYDHFDDNCTTRVRDALDEAAGGALREPVTLPAVFDGHGGPPSYRTHIRRGLVERPLLLWLSDIGVGSAVDRPISTFEAMFLPGALRRGVETHLGAPAERLSTGRDGDLLPADPGSAPYLPWLFAVAGGLALLILVRPHSGLGRTATTVAAALMTLLGTAGLAILLATPLPEFRSSLVALAIPATDALLATRHARWYAPLRLAAGAVFLGLLAAGVWAQPLGWTVLATLLPVAAIAWTTRRARPATA